MRFFSKKKRSVPRLDREEALSAKPALNRLVKLERSEDGNIVLQVPRRQTALVKAVCRAFRLPPYKKVALDELGTFVIELCNGKHTVKDMVDKFSKRFKLNRREAEVSMGTFLRTLAGRSIIGLVLEERGA